MNIITDKFERAQLQSNLAKNKSEQKDYLRDQWAMVIFDALLNDDKTWVLEELLRAAYKGADCALQVREETPCQTPEDTV